MKPSRLSAILGAVFAVAAASACTRTPPELPSEFAVVDTGDALLMKETFQACTRDEKLLTVMGSTVNYKYDPGSAPTAEEIENVRLAWQNSKGRYNQDAMRIMAKHFTADELIAKHWVWSPEGTPAFDGPPTTIAHIHALSHGFEADRNVQAYPMEPFVLDTIYMNTRYNEGFGKKVEANLKNALEEAGGNTAAESYDGWNKLLKMVTTSYNARLSEDASPACRR